MSFSFRNMFSQDGPEDSSDASRENVPEQQPVLGSGPTGDRSSGSFQALFEEAADPDGLSNPDNVSQERSVAPVQAESGNGNGSGSPRASYMASELLAYIPKGLAAPSGIPMEKNVEFDLPADGSTDVKLSVIYRACPQLFVTEITPLNDSNVTLPPKVGLVQSQAQSPPLADNPFAAADEKDNPFWSPPEGNNPDNQSQNPMTPTDPNPGQAVQNPPQSASPFGFPPPEENQQAAAAPNPFEQAGSENPMGQAPSQGFSNIGQVPDQPSNPNPFSDSTQEEAPQAQPPAAANPFEPAPPEASTAPPAAAENPFAADPSAGGFAPPQEVPEQPPSQAQNPFESDGDFNTVFSSKAAEDSAIESPGFTPPEGGTPVNNPFSSDSVGGIPPQQQQQQPAASQQDFAPAQPQPQPQVNPYQAPQQQAPPAEGPFTAPESFQAPPAQPQQEPTPAAAEPAPEIASNPFAQPEAPAPEVETPAASQNVFGSPSENVAPAAAPTSESEYAAFLPPEPAEIPPALRERQEAAGMEQSQPFQPQQEQQHLPQQEQPQPGFQAQQQVPQQAPIQPEMPPAQAEIDPVQQPDAMFQPPVETPVQPEMPAQAEAPSAQPEPANFQPLPEAPEEAPAQPEAPEQPQEASFQAPQEEAPGQQEAPVGFSTPAPDEQDDEANEDMPSFDDLKPISPVVTDKNSFFDEIASEPAAEEPAAPVAEEPSSVGMAPLPLFSGGGQPEPIDSSASHGIVPPGQAIQNEPSTSQPQESKPAQASPFDPPQENSQESAPTPESTESVEEEPAAEGPEMAPAVVDTVSKDVELRAVFGADHDFDIETVAKMTVGLPGVAACAINTPKITTQASRDGDASLGGQAAQMADNARELARLTGVEEASSFTFNTDKGVISMFFSGKSSLAVRHEPGEFDPGVREKLMLVARGVDQL